MSKTIYYQCDVCGKRYDNIAVFTYDTPNLEPVSMLIVKEKIEVEHVCFDCTDKLLDLIKVWRANE